MEIRDKFRERRGIMCWSVGGVKAGEPRGESVPGGPPDHGRSGGVKAGEPRGESVPGGAPDHGRSVSRVDHLHGANGNITSTAGLETTERDDINEGDVCIIATRPGEGYPVEPEQVGPAIVIPGCEFFDAHPLRDEKFNQVQHDFSAFHLLDALRRCHNECALRSVCSCWTMEEKICSLKKSCRGGTRLVDRFKEPTNPKYFSLYALWDGAFWGKSAEGEEWGTKKGRATECRMLTAWDIKELTFLEEAPEVSVVSGTIGGDTLVWPVV